MTGEPGKAPAERKAAAAEGSVRHQSTAPNGVRPEPAGQQSRADPELVEQLYQRYAKGGARLARFRGTAYFYFKKYSWIWVTESTYFVKRLLDFVVSAVMLILLIPLFLLTALAIKLDSPGPVFFKQTRVGKWGRLFTMYKFRSMIVDADKMKEELLDRNESGGIIFKMKRDPRITRVGALIRKLSVDELPQLWNVLKGDMSLVGPRPPVPKEVAEYEYTDRRRLDAIPGITGIWQVSGRSEIDFKGQVRLDVQYIENQSFWGDIKLLLKTIPAVLLGKGLTDEGAIPLKAVILPTTKTAELAPVTSWLPEFLLPVVKKPLVEHLIELLARHEIKEILLVLKHRPFETEAYFGDGSRWGVQLSYSLLSTYRGLVDSLGHLDPSRLEGHFLCLPSDLVTDFDLSSLVNMRREELGDICLVRPSTGSNGSDLETLAVEDLCSLEGNPFLMTRRAFWLMKSLQPVQDQSAGCEIPSSPALSLKVCEAAGSLERIQSPIDLHRVNQRVLGGEFPGLIIPGKMVAAGVWVGRHCRIHPTVRLEAPVLIGDHCNLQSGAVIGSGSVVGDEVIVDEGAAVQGSLVLDRTYVGPHTDLKAVIVRKNWMVQIPSLLSIQLGDDLILGDLEKKTVSAHGDRLLNLALAIVLLIPALPLMAILYLYHLAFPSRRYLVLEERFGSEEQRNLEGKVLPVPFTRYAFRSRNRLVRKLPGLINVIRGELSLVGVSALAASELGELPEEWREMRRNAPVGLFHLWELEAREDLEWEEQMVIDNYYAVSRSLWGDLKILGRGLYAAAFR